MPEVENSLLDKEKEPQQVEEELKEETEQPV
jgi:hypothetical protein